MRCADFEERWQSLLDARVKPEGDELLREHAADCEPCAGLLSSQERLFRVLAQSRRRTAPAFAEAVVQNHVVDRARRVRRDRQFRWLLTLSAAVLLTVAAWSNFRTTSVPPAAVPAMENVAIVEPVSAVPTPALKIDGQQSLPADREIDRQRTAEKLAQAREAIVSFASRLGESSEFDEMSASFEPGLRPIQSSFGLAIDALRRTIPRGREERSTRPNDGAFYFVRLNCVI